MLYVIISMGYKQVFTAESRADALKRAKAIADENKLISWLLYARNGDEVAHCY